MQGSWVQLGMTQPVTPTESFPLCSLLASVSSGRVGDWEQAWQDQAAPPDTPDGNCFLPCPLLPNQKCLTPRGPGDRFPRKPGN